jgi:hypothetical protein
MTHEWHSEAQLSTMTALKVIGERFLNSAIKPDLKWLSQVYCLLQGRLPDVEASVHLSNHFITRPPTL